MIDRDAFRRQYVIPLGHEATFGQPMASQDLESSVRSYSLASWLLLSARLARMVHAHGLNDRRVQTDVFLNLFTPSDQDAIVRAEERILAAYRSPKPLLPIANAAVPHILAKCAVLWAAQTAPALVHDRRDPTPGRVVLALNDLVKRLSDADGEAIKRGTFEEQRQALARGMLLSSFTAESPHDGAPTCVRYFTILHNHDSDPGPSIADLYKRQFGRPFEFDLLMGMLLDSNAQDALPADGSIPYVNLRSAATLLAEETPLEPWIADHSVTPAALAASFSQTGRDVHHPNFCVDIGALRTQPFIECGDSVWITPAPGRIIDAVTWGLRTRLGNAVGRGLVGERFGRAVERYTWSLLDAALPGLVGGVTRVVPWKTDRWEAADAVVLYPAEFVMLQVKGKRLSEENLDLVDLGNAETVFRRTFVESCEQFEKHLSAFRDGLYPPPDGSTSWRSLQAIWPVVVGVDVIPGDYSVRTTLQAYARKRWSILRDDKLAPIEMMDLGAFEDLLRTVKLGGHGGFLDLLREKLRDPLAVGMSVDNWLKLSKRWYRPGDDPPYMASLRELTERISGFLEAGVGARLRRQMEEPDFGV